MNSFIEDESFSLIGTSFAPIRETMNLFIDMLNDAEIIVESFISGDKEKVFSWVDPNGIWIYRLSMHRFDGMIIEILENLKFRNKGPAFLMNRIKFSSYKYLKSDLPNSRILKGSIKSHRRTNVYMLGNKVIGEDPEHLIFLKECGVLWPPSFETPISEEIQALFELRFG